jgi:hypothetical protein
MQAAAGTIPAAACALPALVDPVDRPDQERDCKAQEDDKNDPRDSARRPEAGQQDADE